MCELTCKHVFQSIPITFKAFRDYRKKTVIWQISLQNNSYPIYVLILSSLSIYPYPEAVMKYKTCFKHRRISTLLWKIQLTKLSLDYHQCIKCFPNFNPNSRCYNSFRARLSLKLWRVTRAHGKAMKLPNFRYSYFDTVKSIWEKLVKVQFTKGAFFKSIWVTQEPPGRFFIMSNDSGILYSKTLKAL